MKKFKGGNTICIAMVAKDAVLITLGLKIDDKFYVGLHFIQNPFGREHKKEVLIRGSTKVCLIN